MVALYQGRAGIKSVWHREGLLRRSKKPLSSLTEGVFLVSAKNAFLTVKRVYSVNAYSRISTVQPRSQRSE